MERFILVSTLKKEFYELIRLSLEETARYKVDYTSTGEKAINAISQKDYSVVVLDAEFSENLLKSTFQEIRSSNPDIRIVIIPPQNDPTHSILEGLEPDEFLSLPFFKPDLIEMFDQLVETIQEKPAESIMEQKKEVESESGQEMEPKPESESEPEAIFEEELIDDPSETIFDPEMITSQDPQEVADKILSAIAEHEQKIEAESFDGLEDEIASALEEEIEEVSSEESQPEEETLYEPAQFETLQQSAEITVEKEEESTVQEPTLEVEETIEEFSFDFEDSDQKTEPIFAQQKSSEDEIIPELTEAEPEAEILNEVETGETEEFVTETEEETLDDLAFELAQENPSFQDEEQTKDESDDDLLSSVMSQIESQSVQATADDLESELSSILDSDPIETSSSIIPEVTRPASYKPVVYENDGEIIYLDEEESLPIIKSEDPDDILNRVRAQLEAQGEEIESSDEITEQEVELIIEDETEEIHEADEVDEIDEIDEIDEVGELEEDPDTSEALKRVVSQLEHQKTTLPETEDDLAKEFESIQFEEEFEPVVSTTEMQEDTEEIQYQLDEKTAISVLNGIVALGGFVHALILRNNSIWVHTPDLSADDLQIIEQDFTENQQNDTNREMANFVKLGENKEKYLLFSTNINITMMLVILTHSNTPLSRLKTSSIHYARMIAENNIEDLLKNDPSPEESPEEEIISTPIEEEIEDITDIPRVSDIEKVFAEEESIEKSSPQWEPEEETPVVEEQKSNAQVVYLKYGFGKINNLDNPIDSEKLKSIDPVMKKFRSVHSNSAKVPYLVLSDDDKKEPITSYSENQSWKKPTSSQTESGESATRSTGDDLEQLIGKIKNTSGKDAFWKQIKSSKQVSPMHSKLQESRSDELTFSPEIDSYQDLESPDDELVTFDFEPEIDLEEPVTLLTNKETDSPIFESFDEDASEVEDFLQDLLSDLEENPELVQPVESETKQTGEQFEELDILFEEEDIEVEEEEEEETTLEDIEMEEPSISPEETDLLKELEEVENRLTQNLEPEDIEEIRKIRSLVNDNDFNLAETQPVISEVAPETDDGMSFESFSDQDVKKLLDMHQSQFEDTETLLSIDDEDPNKNLELDLNRTLIRMSESGGLVDTSSEDIELSEEKTDLIENQYLKLDENKTVLSDHDVKSILDELDQNGEPEQEFDPLSGRLDLFTNHIDEDTFSQKPEENNEKVNAFIHFDETLESDSDLDQNNFRFEDDFLREFETDIETSTTEKTEDTETVISNILAEMDAVDFKEIPDEETKEQKEYFEPPLMQSEKTLSPVELDDEAIQFPWETQDDPSGEEDPTPTAPTNISGKDIASEDIVLSMLEQSKENEKPLDDKSPVYTCILVPRLSEYSLNNAIARKLKMWISQLSNAFGWDLENVIVQPTYLQWTVKVSTEISQGYIVRKVRQLTSERLFSSFPDLKSSESSGFWANGYLVVSGRESPSAKFLDEFIQKNRKHQFRK